MDFSSWQSIFATLVGLTMITIIGVGIRVWMMLSIQQRRERANRQINERLRVLIAAYKTLGGSFTGDLAVNPQHLRDLRRTNAGGTTEASAEGANTDTGESGSDRSRRIRDAVEAALSDIILLGTETQVELAARAARELAAGRPVHTDELVVSLRNFIREALDLDPISPDLDIPTQGPTRPGGAGNRGKGETGRGGGGRGGMGMGAGGGTGAGMGLGAGSADETPNRV